MQGGVAMPSNASATFAYGVVFVYKPGANFGVGAFLNKYGNGLDTESDTSTISTSSSNFWWGFEGDYFFKGSLNNFHGGVRMGFLSVSTEGTATDTTSGASFSISEASTRFFVGPKLAYDYMMGRWSVGAELSWMISFGGPKTIYFFPSVKFWF